MQEDLLHGCWVRSNEEDAGGEIVFRRPSHPLPRTRGRTEIELKPDGTYVESSPGPVDVPEAATGRWALEKDRLTLRPDAGGAERCWSVASSDPERLAVRPD